jgi:HTH-type transcriptional regulator / antitoxin HigA
VTQAVKTCARPFVKITPHVPAHPRPRRSPVVPLGRRVPRPLQTSLSDRWEDIFWFRFIHKAAHVLQHCKKRSFLEGLEVATDDESQVWEDEADRFAARILIPAEYESNLRRLTVTDVPDFAEMLVIDPGIVIGRLQHDGLIRLIALKLDKTGESTAFAESQVDE